ncbi:hypothetical protein [Streptomyces sp. NPDC057052]|uniref:hypothetical protein n=1 Tax=Streptomyces sp. NPDC057052 TaxID=3346010 RepID=UPI003634ED1D
MPGGNHLADLGRDERLADGCQDLAAVKEIGGTAVPGRGVRVDRGARTVTAVAGEARAGIAAGDGGGAVRG